MQQVFLLINTSETDTKNFHYTFMQRADYVVK